jgi:hypothetical protein
MSLIRENFIELEGSIQKVVDAYLSQKTDYLPLLFNVANSERSQENHFSLGGLGEMTAWNGSVSYQEIMKGYEKNYRHIKYSTGQQVEEAVLRFKDYAEIKKRANKLGQAVHKTIQKHAAAPFNFAFDATVLGSDGVPLASASHRICPNDDAGVQSNTGTFDMTVDNIETIKRQGRAYMDDKGDIMDVELSLIVCGTYWEKTAKQICGSDKEPYGADNQKNIYKEEVKYIVNPYITGKKWALVNPDIMKGGEGLNWYWARDPKKVEYVDDFDTEVGKYKSVGWWSKGWDVWYFGNFQNPA